MEQQLYFESAWERTISEKDREAIKKIFSEENKQENGLTSTYIRHAINHRGRLLYMVLLHNNQDEPYVFQEKKVTLSDMIGNFTVGTFTIPVEIPPHSSMPWTFIFAEETYENIEIMESSLLL